MECSQIRRDGARDREPFVTVTQSDIEQAVEQFKNIEVELYKIRRAIEARLNEKANNVE